jgi:hypothetical protein
MINIELIMFYQLAFIDVIVYDALVLWVFRVIFIFIFNEFIFYGFYYFVIKVNLHQDVISFCCLYL